MASSEERLKILQMIQDGKITADDGAKLLGALAKGNKSKSGLLIKNIEIKLIPPTIKEIECVIFRLVIFAKNINKNAKTAAKPL